MIVKLHKNARTTPAIRAQLAASNESVTVLAKRFNLAPNTVRKWQARTEFNDRSHTAHNLQTTLSSAQEHIVIYLRKHLLLPLDDLLSVTREFLCPEVSRSGLNRCLRRHGVGNLRDMTRSQDNKPKYQRFKDYPIGFVHIDIKYLPQMADESKRKYLFVAIDRATRMVCVQLRESKTAKDAREFLKFVTERFPFEIKKVLTDNGKEFTNKVLGNNATNKTHEFDDLCLSLGIEHRLTRVRRPQTNGMVERFNGRIADILRTHHFQSGKELEHTLLRYVNLYNNHLPQANLNCRTPYQVMYEWYENKPQFFDKVVHNRKEHDTILDARVSAALNCIQLIDATKEPIFFLHLPGRNKDVVSFREDPKFKKPALRQQGWRSTSPATIYQEYNDLLTAVCSQHKDIPRYKIEMALFADAIELIQKATNKLTPKLELSYS